MKATFSYKNIDTENIPVGGVPGCEVLTGEVPNKHKAREIAMKK
jgi:hypothetical protein